MLRRDLPRFPASITPVLLHLASSFERIERWDML